MNLRAVVWLLGCVVLIVAAFLLVPAAVSAGYGEWESMQSFLLSAGIGAAIGLGLTWFTRGSTVTEEGRPDYFRREGLAVVGLSWLVAGAVGALPYMLSGVLADPIDAFFESVSGFTTTGSSVMSGETIDGMSRGVGFWRSFTHWLGGFGIVMVFVVLFPTGGRSLFRSEIPGISREAGHQRVRDSAIGLMRIYVGLTVIEFVLLMFCGMDWFDSIVHTFGTVATGGFSTHSSSVAHFASFPIEFVITLFMFLAGVNFAVYDAFLRVGPRPAWRRVTGSLEIRTYTVVVVGSTLFIGFVLWFWGGSNGRPASDLPAYQQLSLCIRDAMFQVVCLVTSTGYATADFDRWPQICRVLLMMLAVGGACAGSTGGGIKLVRMIIVFKAAVVGVRRFARPRAIHAVRIDGQTLEEGTVASVTGYFALWIAVFLFGTVALSAFGIDLVSASTSVLATLNNIGPGLKTVGPAMNFGELPGLAKLLLSLFMILGRLEFYAVVVLIVPGFWRR